MGKYCSSKDCSFMLILVKEFYAKMKVTHLRKKDVIKSSVKGIDIEFDHERLATYLVCTARNGICEYIEEVWEESKYTKPLEITRRVANDETITNCRKSEIRRLVDTPRVMMRHMSYVISMKDHELPYGDWLTLVFEAFGVPLVIKKGEEPKKYDFFEDTFLTMCKMTREDGVWWIGSGENRRRDDAPEEEEEEEEERNKDDFDWEAVIDEATVEGESGSDDQFYDARVETAQRFKLHLRLSRKIKNLRSRPLGSYCERLNLRNSEREFERKRANRFHDDLEKAKRENAGLLALLHQAQSKSNH
ncbi:hypothetical protein Dimus_032093 [Dionaea muscipula]